MYRWFKTLYQYRELLYSVTIRSIKVRYKQTFLGIAWAVLQPLSLMALLTIIFSKFARFPTDGMPHVLFYYSGLLPWTFVSASVSFAVISLVNNSELVSKIYLPREIFPIACVFASFFDFLVASVIFGIMLIIFAIPFTGYFLYLVPVLMILILITLAVSLLVSVLNVYYRDVKYIMNLIMQLWMFSSPVIYPMSIVPQRFQFLYMFNPLTVVIDSFRRIILQGRPPGFSAIGIAAAISLVLFFVSYRVFKSLERNLADVI